MAQLTRQTRRKNRVHTKIRKLSSATRPRLSVFRSGKHIYAQIIDDSKGQTICAMSTVNKPLKEKLAKTSDKAAAEEVGKHLARIAKEKGITKVVFDRGSYLFHGRVEALATGARAEGLEF